ncbi:unnamed protein product [Schistosoma mattheei]|uniref:Uncharacterized protein n=1 Tax=Schistosoma mattheei TaxID=31246 RepID=A0A183NM39_9TREM|nr:unnamed protein product [Schistosoma mattheei]
MNLLIAVLVILPDMSYLNNSHVFDEVSFKNEKNMSGASDDDLKLNVILINASYPNGPLSTDEVSNKFDSSV